MVPNSTVKIRMNTMLFSDEKFPKTLFRLLVLIIINNLFFIIFPGPAQSSRFPGDSEAYYTSDSSPLFNAPFDTATSDRTFDKCVYLRIPDTDIRKYMKNRLERMTPTEKSKIPTGRKQFLRIYKNRITNWPLYKGGFLISLLGGGQVSMKYYFLPKKNVSTKAKLLEELKRHRFDLTNRCSRFLFDHYLKTNQEGQMKESFVQIQNKYGPKLLWFEKYHSPTGLGVWGKLTKKYFGSTVYINSIETIRNKLPSEEIRRKSLKIINLINELYPRIKFENTLVRMLLTKAKAQALLKNYQKAKSTIEKFLKKYGKKYTRRKGGELVFFDKNVSLDYPIIKKPQIFLKKMKTKTQKQSES